MNSAYQRIWAVVLCLAMATLVVACGGDDEEKKPEAATKARPAAKAQRPDRAPEPAPSDIGHREATARAERFVDELKVKVELPDYYPGDAPVYPDTPPSAATVLPRGSVSVQFGTTDSAADVKAWVLDFLPTYGWQLTAEQDVSGGSVILAIKGQRQLKVLVSTVGTMDDQLTMLAVDVTPES
jgi:hypothetical protein